MQNVGKTLSTPEELLETIGLALQDKPTCRRLIVAIAGAPASGKSTLAQQLVDQINSETIDEERAVVVPMDGFHLDNRILDQHQLRSVKGAPHTFDAVGFQALVERLAAPIVLANRDHPDDPDAAIYIPVFDRTMDLARCAGSAVTSMHRIIVLEGNYLLLDRPVWRDLHQFIDLSVFLDVPESILEKRLIKRWLDHGLDEQSAKNRALSNDIPNAQVVTRESTSAHLRFTSVR